MNARVLPPDEWHKLADLYGDEELRTPAFVFCVEDGDTIIGAWPFYLLPFGGMMMVAKEHRGNGIPAALADLVRRECAGGQGALFTIISNPHAEKLALANGMQPVEGKVYRQDL